MTVEEIRAGGKFVDKVKGLWPDSLYSNYMYKDKYYLIHDNCDELVAEIDRDGNVKLFHLRDQAILKKLTEGMGR